MTKPVRMLEPERDGTPRSMWPARLIGAVYLAWAMIVMWHAPRVPYADGWRFLGHFASADFPRDIFMPDNGHFEVIPNIVRVIELHLFDADQSLQVWIGIILFLASLYIGWRCIRGAASPERRAAAILAMVLGFCWLGNARTLAHANESVHAYAVLFFLCSGIGFLARQSGPVGMRNASMAAVCGFCAAISFGSGIAVFSGFLVIAIARQAPARSITVLLFSATASYLLIRSAGAGAAPELDPLRQLDLALRWLSAPWLHAAGPVVDPAVSNRLASPIARGALIPVAERWEAAMGPAALARWPYVAISAIGISILATVTYRSIRRGGDGSARLLGLGMSWFALSVGMMVATVRTAYFDIHPDQLMAPRYLVWSSLFWSGLAITLVAGTQWPRRALLTSIVASVTLLPSQFWTSQLAGDIRVVAGQTATAAAVGVIEPDLLTGETVAGDLARALPPLRRLGAAVFAWPETGMLARVASQSVHDLAVADINVEPVANLLGPPGRRVRFIMSDPGAHRVLLIDDDGVVRGLAAPDAMRGAGAWIGWMRGQPATSRVRVSVLRPSVR